MKKCKGCSGDYEDLIENEREWRRFMAERICAIEKEVSSLKSRVATTSAFVGAAASFLMAWIKTKAGIQ